MGKKIDWKLLIATPDRPEAFLLKNRLESEGIPCRIRSDTSYPGARPGGREGMVSLYVPVSEFETSLQILEEGDLEEEGP